jgi:uncharacterized protein with von Willebrand factor type A (vWA) domain
MSDDLLSGFGTKWALRRLQERGMPGLSGGLDELRRRVMEARMRMADRLDAGGPLQHVKEQLDRVVSTERATLDEADDEDAIFRNAMLDALPNHPAGAIRELKDYQFRSSEAARMFGEMMDELQREVLNTYFRNISGAMKDMTPEDLDRIKDMLADLNAMIAARDEGRPYDFDGFMNRYGDMFPENPKNLDELLETMAKRAMAMSRLMAGMSPEQRAELAELTASITDDLDLAFQMDQLASSLRDLMPQMQWDEPADAWGDQSMPMSQAVDAIERASDLEDLDNSLTGAYEGATLDDVDPEKLRLLGDDAVQDLERLKQIEKALESAGVVNRRHGNLEMTARGARLLGERALTNLLDVIKRQPTHRAAGGAVEPTGQTRPWEFGSEDPINVQRTLYNAVTRGGAGRSIKLEPGDFEVTETETRPRTATALLLDLSFSMPLRGHWVHAKRMALALNALIEGKYPGDSLYLIGFSDYARKMKAHELADVAWERVHGTNMEHAFLLAQRVLGDDPRPIKQVLMVTDGEPTAHLEDGYAVFNWPPVTSTIEKTLREAVRLSRSGIAINVFMLENTPELATFMDRLSHLTGGKTFLVESEGIGGAVLREYMHGRDRSRRAS